jgi:hypothetical protein
MTIDQRKPFPWNWDPSRRLNQNLELFEDVARDERFEWETQRPSVLAFCAKAMHQYVIPHEAANVIDTYIFGLPGGEIGDQRSLLEVAQNEENHIAVMQRFEQELLGLEPTSSSNGLRWWESAAGFASGIYPTEAVSKTVSISPEELYEYIGDDPLKYKPIMLRSGDFLFNVIGHHDKNKVHTSDVFQLTKMGSAVLEVALSAYARGLEATQSDS